MQGFAGPQGPVELMNEKHAAKQTNTTKQADKPCLMKKSLSVQL